MNWQERRNINEQVRAALVVLGAEFRELAVKALRFIDGHSYLTMALLIGLVIAYLLGRIPLVGSFLGLTALGLLTAAGVLGELRAELRRLFDQITGR